jgi:hypothetical protein
MVSLNIPADIIVRVMRESGTKFTADDVMCLTDGGAPEKVLAQARRMSGVAAADPVAPLFDQDFVEKVNRNWRGLGIGYDNGLWGSSAAGSSFAQGIKVDIPFGPRVGQFVGVRVRGLVAHGEPWSAPGFEQTPHWEPLYVAGAELFGRGPVWCGIVRASGGGGAYYGSTRWVGDYPADYTGLAVGGHFGVEAILWPRGSFTFEVGGQTGPDGASRGSGASVMGGIMVYLGGLGV